MFHYYYPGWVEIIWIKALLSSTGLELALSLATRLISICRPQVILNISQIRLSVLEKCWCSLVGVCLPLHPLGWALSLWRLLGPKLELLFSNLNWNLLVWIVKTQPKMNFRLKLSLVITNIRKITPFLQVILKNKCCNYFL